MNSALNSAPAGDVIVQNDADNYTASIARSILFYRMCVVASLLCAVGGGIVAVLALNLASEGRVFTVLGFVMVTLVIVVLAMGVACVKVVAQLRARAAREEYEH